MKALKYNFFLGIILIFSSLEILQSCSDKDGTVDCFPRRVINFTVNRTTYDKVYSQGGWDYTKGEDGTGSRGLIIFNTGTGFKIYDRNAPHLCPDNNTTLEVKNINGIDFLYCPKDGAEWLLNTGEPKKIANVPPKPYSYSINNGILYIYN